MEEYGIIEYLELTVTICGCMVDGKQRIYLEWPKAYALHSQHEHYYAVEVPILYSHKTNHKLYNCTKI